MEIANPFSLIIQRLDTLETLIINAIKELTPNLPTISSTKPLTVKEAAAYLNLAVSTVYGMVQRREIPFYKRKKRLYFEPADLAEYVINGRQRTANEIQEAVKNQNLTIKHNGKKNS